jgi:hypothetical protein
LVGPRFCNSSKVEVTKDALLQRAPGMYRFRELTPLDDGELPVTLGEGATPLLWPTGCGPAKPRKAVQPGRAPVLQLVRGREGTEDA